MKCSLFAFAMAICIALSSCSRPQVHLHDRHVHSYDVIKEYAERNGACTLVLLDYHHDIHPGQAQLSSINWAGRLLEEGSVSSIIWLSGRTLLLPNRNARMAWLERCLQDCYPQTADFIRRNIQLCDWQDLQAVRLSAPFVVTLDFDVFMKDPGPDPDAFVEELCGWIQSKKPDLLTLCLSAAYQPDCAAAWEWLERFATHYTNSATWHLESDGFGSAVESNDERWAWMRWRQEPELFQSGASVFYQGAYLWQQCPSSVREALLKKGIKAADDSAKSILNAWQDPTLQILRRTHGEEMLERYSTSVTQAVHAVWNGQSYAPPSQSLSITDPQSRGVAVRFKTKDIDRGCLALYGGLRDADIPLALPYCTQEACTDPRYPPITMAEQDELFINLSLFGPWQDMESPLDFVPGIDSLLLENTETGERTLLQAAVAMEHGHTKESFLSRLSNKAGLGLGGWNAPTLRYYKSKTLTYTKKAS